MDYFQSNKAAWEEAFDNRREGWGDDMCERLANEKLPYLSGMLKETVLSLDLRDKVVAQFCCNNGQEVLSLTRLGAKRGVGFDIAENMIARARETAEKASIPCAFHACNILHIGAEFNGTFDLVLFTIGAITWFEDLQALFKVAARCLKPGGMLLINDYHPFVNMLPLPGEDAFHADSPNRVAYPYFRTEPWLESNSGAYMTQHRNTHTFTSFSHTMAEIVNAAVAAGLSIASLREYDLDIGMTDAYNGKGFPLSYTLQAVKPT
ncbi:MAG: methyltransferase domain-containing protein [Bacillota bacterium]